MSRVTTFAKAQAVTDLIENGHIPSGNEIGGLILPPMVLEALAQAKMNGGPCEFVVTGEEWGDNGKHHLTFGVPAEFVEAHTDYRHEDHDPEVRDMTRGSLHYVCPECATKRGQHVRGCPRRVA